jgi:hypothetical protein
MPTCSKAPRGLFVLSWGTRIFTGAAVSPGPLLRQRPSRYSFRAGRNLPDKEFRYLRTVRVTAAVDRGFGSGLRAPPPLTVRHWAGVSPYTSASAFAETGVFGKQSLGPIPCGPPRLAGPAGPPGGAPLLPKVRGHFAEFLSRGSPEHLGSVTPSPPVSVCGTVGRRHTTELFSTTRALDHSGTASRPSVRPSARAPAGICRGRPPTGVQSPCPLGALADPVVSLRRVPASRGHGDRCRNVRLLSIAYADWASA